jgi:hypothetical protein
MERTSSSRWPPVADYTPENPQNRKIKKSSTDLTITLKADGGHPGRRASRPNAPYCVGFAAESHDVPALRRRQRKRKNVPLLSPTAAADALGSDSNEVICWMTPARNHSREWINWRWQDASSRKSRRGRADVFTANDRCRTQAQRAAPATPKVLNVGGNTKLIPIPKHYDGWDHLLLDIDPTGKPDVLCDAR